MSRSVESVEVLSSRDFSIPLDKLAALGESLEDDLPEGHLFDPDWLDRDFLCRVEGDRVYPHLIWWYGDGASATLHVLLEDVLPDFDGEADILIVFEGGEMQGFRVKDHQVVEHEVDITLGDPLPAEETEGAP